MVRKFRIMMQNLETGKYYYHCKEIAEEKPKNIKVFNTQGEALRDLEDYGSTGYHYVIEEIWINEGGE